MIDTLLSIDTDSLIALGLAIALGGVYLLVLPALTMWYLNQRWYVASSIERLLMYGFVFFTFPGLLLISPFINYRPQKAKS